MKLTLLFISVTLFSLSQSNVLQENKVNVATILIDAYDFTYYGGNLSFYDCMDCTNDSLPFKGHGSSVKNWYLENDTMIFSGGNYVWWRPLSILYPIGFVGNYPFNIDSQSSLLDATITYYDSSQTKTYNPNFINQANNVLNQTLNLPIYQEFGAFNYQLGIFYLKDELDNVDINSGKSMWIIFLYYNYHSTTNVSQKLLNQLEINPNPVQDIIKLDENQKSYEIYNLSGQSIMKGDLENTHTIDVKNLSQGSYLLKIESKEGNIQSIKFMK
jgi:hypothetical protein